jgi:hypothetical protein
MIATATRTRLLNQLAAGVAAALGAGWRCVHAVHHGDGARLEHPGGRALQVVYNDWQSTARLYITGEYPPGDAPPGLTRSGITAAVSRGPAAIAQDITRRLLPGYEAELAAVREHQARQARWAAGRAATAARIGALPGAEPPVEGADTIVLSHPGWQHASRPGPAGLWDGRAEVHDDGSEVSLHIHAISADVALRMLAILTKPTRDLCGGSHTPRPPTSTGQAMAPGASPRTVHPEPCAWQAPAARRHCPEGRARKCWLPLAAIASGRGAGGCTMQPFLPRARRHAGSTGLTRRDAKVAGTE